MTNLSHYKKNIISGGFLNVQGISESNTTHKYFGFTTIRKGLVSEVSLKLTKRYLSSVKQNAEKWRKDKRLFTIFNSDLKRQSKQFIYLAISKFVRENNHFDHHYFDLPWLHECWLDHSNNHRMTFHRNVDGQSWITFLDADLEVLYNNKFPLKPQIAREGVLLSSFFEPIIDRMIKSRIRLVEESQIALTLDWLFDLRGLINDSLSSIDILLNTIYTKAELDPPKGWSFDKSKLGDKHNIRFKDKLKWIYKISGNHLNIEKEISSLMHLKQIRNHLNHFDPPCFAMTLEEVASWFNMILDIGLIHINIRETMGIQTSILLYNFILQPEIRFIPQKEFEDRVSLDPLTDGYETSIWK
jgi:hypothetical protein